MPPTHRSETSRRRPQRVGVLGERLCGVVQRCGNVLRFQIRMLTDDIVDAHSSGDHPQHGDDGEAKAPDAWSAIHLVRLDRDALVYLRAHWRSPHVSDVRMPTAAMSTLIDLCPSLCRSMV